MLPRLDFQVSNTTPVHVTATLAFSPQTLAVAAMNVGQLSLTLSGPAPANGLTIKLSSNNPGVAEVPAIVSFQPFTTAVTVPVFGVAPGTTVINAKASTLATATAIVTVN